jgi:hypothetical protein
MTGLLTNNWIFLKPLGWPKLKKRINKLHEKTARFIPKVESVSPDAANVVEEKFTNHKHKVKVVAGKFGDQYRNHERMKNDSPQ